MKLTVAQLSARGPVRPINEDFLAYWIPDDDDERKKRGCAIVIADGIGGQADGEVASRLAVETAIEQFKTAAPAAPLNSILWRMINEANLAVYDAGMAKGPTSEGRMGTTLTVMLLRNTDLAIGHVGDCRVYLIQGGQIKQLTTDHTQVTMHQRLGQLVAGVGAGDAPIRGMLARSIGKDHVVQIDNIHQTVHVGDIVLQCTDGLHAFLTPDEILQTVLHNEPDDICHKLIQKAESRGSDDNLSLQVVRVDHVERLTYYRGLPLYTEAKELMDYELKPGQVLDDRFEITDLVSRSGMASIFKAKDRQAGNVVAIKVPLLQYESDPAFYSRFEREEQIGKSLDHPAILKIFPVDPERRSRPYIVMELLDGITLDRAMHQQQPMNHDEAVRIAAAIAGGLAYMHSKEIIHRDIKPQNIMLCQDGSVRIMDFGIAKNARSRRLTFTGFTPAMGTPDYMAPEQVRGKRGDHRTDIYSLGAILYEMVTGQVPFEGQNPFQIMQARVTGDPVAPRKINPAVRPPLEEVILHAMARDPWDRYASAADMQNELLHLDTVELTGRHERLQKPEIWKSRWRQVGITILLILVPILLFAVIYLATHRR